MVRRDQRQQDRRDQPGHGRDLGVPDAHCRRAARSGSRLGPDGNIWFTEFAADKIGEINPTTHAITDIPDPDRLRVAGGHHRPDRTGTSGSPRARREQDRRDQPHDARDHRVPRANLGQSSRSASPPDRTGTSGSPRRNARARSASSTRRRARSASSRRRRRRAQPNAIAAGPDGTPLVHRAGRRNKIACWTHDHDHAITSLSDPDADRRPAGHRPGRRREHVVHRGRRGKVGVDQPGHARRSRRVPDADGILRPGRDRARAGRQPVVHRERRRARSARSGAVRRRPWSPRPRSTGTRTARQTLHLPAATWSAWAGQQPTFGFGFDGFRWLLDGSPIAGATAQTLAIPAADVGHKISCEELAPIRCCTTTVTSTSAPVTVSPSLGASLLSTAATPTTVTLTLSCQGLPSQRCTGTAKLTAHVTTQGSKVVAVAAKAKKKPKPKPPQEGHEGRDDRLGLLLDPDGQELDGEAVAELDRQEAAHRALQGAGHADPHRHRVGEEDRDLQVRRHQPLAVLHLGVRQVVQLRHRADADPPAQGLEGRARLPRPRLPVRQEDVLGPQEREAGARLRAQEAPPQPARDGRRIQITAANEVGEVVIFTIVSGKSPTETFRCLPPGARTPTACAA